MPQKCTTAFLLLLLALAAYGQAPVLTDSRDSKTYKWAKIGTQTWMAENLNYKAEGSLCYGNDPANCQKYGRLYDWNTAMKACPSGWHLPSDAEWSTLVDFAGGEVAGKKLKSRDGWYNNGNGEDSFGFSALPSGVGNSTGDFYDVGKGGGWWSATEETANHAYYRPVYYRYANVIRYYGGKTTLFSVRCVQD